MRDPQYRGGIFRLTCGITVAACVAACDRPSSATGQPARSPAEQVATYEVRGVLKKADPQRLRAIIAHERIADYMEPMTMEFTLLEAQELDGLQPGDTIAFRLSVTDSRAWIDRVRKSDHVPSPEGSSEPGALSADPRVLQPGALLPECNLIDQGGRPIRLSEFKGRALALTFIFTRCPLPDFCPRMSRNFAEVRRLLAASSAATNWQLLSITIDPAYDTPERLAAHAKTLEADPDHWVFVTGDVMEIQRLSGAFGLAVVPEGGQLNHNLRTVVVDAAGRVQKVFAGNEWAPSELADEMKRAMAAGR